MDLISLRNFLAEVISKIEEFICLFVFPQYILVSRFFLFKINRVAGLSEC